LGSGLGEFDRVGGRSVGDQGRPGRGDGDEDEVRSVGRAVGSFVELPLWSIEPNPLQPRSRFDDEELAALASSIVEVGVLQPVLVRRIEERRYELVAGERRFRAARLAGLEAIPAVVREVGDRTSLEHAIVENLHRSDLSAVEEAAAYRQLMDEFALTQDEVARRVGKSRSAVANTLRLLQLPAAVQRLVLEGELSAGHARALVGVEGTEAQIRLAARVVSEELSVRETERLARAEGRQPGAPGGQGSGGDGKGRSVAVLEIEQVLAERLDTRVTVTVARNRGRLVVEFADLDDLERIFRELDGG
jgi:ParB family chromosome partitioning protein